jgi:RNA polymerase sigma-70 factor (ECF subfamily)
MIEMNNEAKLLQRLQQMDEQVLAEVYDTFNQEIFRYACGLLGNIDLAEECVAETFSRFLLALSNGGGPRDYLRAYLYRVAHNWISDLHRRQPLPEMSLDDDLKADPTMQMTAFSTSDPAHVAVDVLERDQLRSALARLTNEQRQVITLKYLADLENDEIAQTLNKPVGAVKSLQFRALAALRRMLPEERDGNVSNSLHKG